MTVTSTEFLDSVKRAVSVPANQARFTDADLMKFADEETQSTILPMLTSLRQEYLVKYKDTAIVADLATYKIAHRAIGRTLRDLAVYDSSGKFVRTLNYIAPEQALGRQTGTGEPTAFTVQGENIILLPAPGSTVNYLRQLYELAPSDLTTTTNAGTVASFDTTTGVVTLSAAVDALTTGLSMDIIDGKTGNSVLAEGITCTNVSGTELTFDAEDLPSTMAAGDYVALAGHSPVVQLPKELIQSLVQAVVCRVLESLGDYEGLRASEEKLKKKLDSAMSLLSPRIEGKTPVVSRNNGLLNRSRSMFPRQRYP